jgi:hypothetical protein
VSVASTPEDFEQGGMWLNITAEGASRADTTAAAVTAHAEHYQTLVQLRKLAATFVAEPGNITSAGVCGSWEVLGAVSVTHCRTCVEP